MKKIYLILIASILFIVLPAPTKAAGGIYASGGGSQVAGGKFTVTVNASGASFNALEGVIAVSGPVSIVSFSPGGAVWMTSPANNVHFVGMLTSSTNSLRVATITLKGTGAGSGKVSVSGVRLALTGNSVGTGAGGVNFTITRAPTPPGTVAVTSSSHADQAQQYEATTIILNWDKPTNGATGYSYLLDEAADTTPAEKATSVSTTISYENQKIGAHYFHIRAQNADGWGPTTHFKINIKEPENKIESKLPGPKNIKIGKSKEFKNDVNTGTVTGLVITGNIPTKIDMEKFVTQLDSTQSQDPILVEKAAIYSANIIFSPSIVVPEGKSLNVEPDQNGNFRLAIDYPISSGFHKIIIQGQRAKVLTKPYETIFEISQKNGGQILLLSERDAKPAPITKPSFWQKHKLEIKAVASVLAAEIILLAILMILKLIKNRGARLPKKEKRDKQNFDWDKA